MHDIASSHLPAALQRLPPVQRAAVLGGSLLVGGWLVWNVFVRTRGLVRAVDDVRLFGIDWPIFGDAEELADAIATAYPNAAPAAVRLVEVAKALDLHPYALANVIEFESGWRTTARNPTSGATGFLNWTPATAVSLGSSTRAIAAMDAAAQLDLVQRYLARVASAHGALDSIKRLAMAVFYPTAMSWPSWAMFPRAVRRANPGIAVVADYVEKVQDRAKLPWSSAI